MLDALLLADALPLAEALSTETLPQETPYLKVTAYVSMAMLAASFCAWLWIYGRWQEGKPAIDYARRHSVPWRGGEVLFVIGFLLVMTIGSAVSSTGEAEPRTLDDFARMFLFGSVFNIGLASAVGMFLVLARKADGRDLGLIPKLPEDFAIGGLGWLAAILPVYSLQIVLVYLVAGDRQTHPLLETLQESPRIDVLALAAFAAVIVAPLVEEFLFRVLLQGWLEKKLAPKRDGGDASSTPTVIAAAEVLPAAGEGVMLDDLQTPVYAASADEPWDAYRSPVADFAAPRDSAMDVEPQPSGWRGSMPIVISSLIFASAHAGTWPDPAPLFVLALVLGYVYRQTHRLWPSVILHMLFNGLSLAMVWFGAE